MNSLQVNNGDIHTIKPVLRPSFSSILSQDEYLFRCEKARVTLIDGFINGNSEISGDMNISLPQWITGILEARVKIKDKSIEKENALLLSVADRDLLIINLRMMTFGHEIRGITVCPHQNCGEKFDFTFDLTSLEIPHTEERKELLKATFNRNKKPVNFSFRMPNGSDQEAIADLLSVDSYEAFLCLVSRCVVNIDGLSCVSPEILSGFPENSLTDVEKAISKEMLSFDWDIKLLCPECENEIISTLDIQSFFWKEIQIAKDDLWNEVHKLAFYYHWPESDILALSRWKRKMYLNYINNHINR
ncbi:hypothetical protein HY745_03640 [Candidatus Desantisbacteria bacterium]|nr:hypothetical protein [Candidatus Desantisbacteria bacterium]